MNDDAVVVACAGCGRALEPEYEEAYEVEGPDGDAVYYCPHCKETEKLEECCMCGQWLLPDQVYKHKSCDERLCEYCYDDLYVT